MGFAFGGTAEESDNHGDGSARARQDQMMVRWDELPKSPGPAFYDHLQAVLKEGDVDTFAAELCQPFYAARMATPSLPPGRDFRMHLGSHF